MTLPTDPKDTSPTNADDPFGGMDMMAWMESLAKRQGASSDELTTAANIDVPLPPPDAVVTGPGYTPGYDIPKSKTPAAPPPPPVVVPPPAPIPEPVQVAPTPVAAAVDPNDPFGGMDMMAWMESLAKRQGASSDELTTAADMDIPLPPADTVVDEPGYTPGYDVSTSKKPAAQSAAAPVPTPVQAASPPQPAPVVIPPPAPIPEPVQVASAPVAAAVDPNDPFGGMDMMAWMESLAKRQGASSDELTTAADMDIPLPPADTVIDEPGYTPGYDVSTSKKPAAQPAAATVPVEVPAALPAAPVVSAAPVVPPTPVVAQPPTPPVVAAPVSDPFALADQMADPMAWLETLAKRQGANPEELMTSADMNIPEPPANTVIDEPGYSDYSPFGGSAPVSEAMDTPSMSSAEAAALLGLSDKAAEPNPLSMMDPLAWLESLSAPQATGGTVDFSTFTSPSSETSEAMEAASALSWLEQLAREAQGYETETPSGSIITPASFEAQPEPDISETWVDTTPARADELGGLSDDMSQLQQWLAAQANSLSEVRDLDESPAFEAMADENTPDFADASLTDAAPGEIPDWLREHMPGTTTAESSFAVPSPLSEIFDEPAIPADLPAWLMENVSTGTSADMFGFDTNAAETEPASDLSAESAGFASEYDFVAADELAAPNHIAYEDTAETEDPWVEAFEYEESRRLAGDENEIPDWYTEALIRSGEIPAGSLPESSGEPQPETQSDVLTSGDYPTWLTGLMADDTSESTQAAVEESFGLSDFTEAEQPIMAGDLPSWLIESLPDSSGIDLGTLSFDSNQFDTPNSDIEMADLPDWLRASEPKEEPTPVAAVVPPPVPVAPPPPVQPPSPVPKPVAADVRDFWGAAQSIAQAIPTPAPKVEVPAAPPATPVTPAPVTIDHGQRLQRARELVAQGQYNESLTHYQSLIDSEAALDHVIGDMQTIVQAQPTDPSARRLLGDAHLRKGNLQDALDTYRKALDQL